jgi:hypothetical protein
MQTKIFKCYDCDKDYPCILTFTTDFSSVNPKVCPNENTNHIVIANWKEQKEV